MKKILICCILMYGCIEEKRANVRPIVINKSENIEQTKNKVEETELKTENKDSSNQIEKMYYRKYLAPHIDPMHSINKSINPWYDYGY